MPVDLRLIHHHRSLRGHRYSIRIRRPLHLDYCKPRREVPRELHLHRHRRPLNNHQSWRPQKVASRRRTRAFHSLKSPHRRAVHSIFLAHAQASYRASTINSNRNLKITGLRTSINHRRRGRSMTRQRDMPLERDPQSNIPSILIIMRQVEGMVCVVMRSLCTFFLSQHAYLSSLLP